VILTGQLMPTNTGALKVGSITWNSTTGALTGGTGIAMTEFGLIGANSGTSTFSLSATTGALTLLGNITGGSNINISGSAKFDGLTSVSGSSYTMSVNESLGQDNGIYVVAKTGGNAAIEAIGSGSSDGVDGTTATGFGVSGFATGAAGIGVVATNSAGGTALQVVGKMTISSSTLVTNLNADMVDGLQGSALCNVVTTNTGTCTVSGGGFQNLVTGPLASTVQTRGTGNIVYIENVSDARLKTDIQDESLGLDFINSLRPRSFRMLSSQSVKSHGLIYQEVSELLSECDSLAMLNDNEIGGVDYNGIVSPIIKAIQQLSDSVDQLKQEK